MQIRESLDTHVRTGLDHSFFHLLKTIESTLVINLALNIIIKVHRLNSFIAGGSYFYLCYFYLILISLTQVVSMVLCCEFCSSSTQKKIIYIYRYKIVVRTKKCLLTCGKCLNHNFTCQNVPFKFHSYDAKLLIN